MDIMANLNILKHEVRANYNPVQFDFSEEMSEAYRCSISTFHTRHIISSLPVNILCPPHIIIFFWGIFDITKDQEREERSCIAYSAHHGVRSWGKPHKSRAQLTCFAFLFEVSSQAREPSSFFSRFSLVSALQCITKYNSITRRMHELCASTPISSGNIMAHHSPREGKLLFATIYVGKKIPFCSRHAKCFQQFACVPPFRRCCLNLLPCRTNTPFSNKTKLLAAINPRG